MKPEKAWPDLITVENDLDGTTWSFRCARCPFNAEGAMGDKSIGAVINAHHDHCPGRIVETYRD